jgi:hypothetical protein
MVDSVPSLEEFKATARESFAFLIAKYGFVERQHAGDDAFRVRFERPGAAVVVAGEGHGTAADVRFENARGDVLSFIWLVPTEARPGIQHRGPEPGQLSILRHQAELIAQHCGDFLSGDASRFERALVERQKMARPSR